MTRANPLDRFAEQKITPDITPGGVLSLIPSAREMKRAAETDERLARRKASRAAFDKKFPCTSYFVPAHLREDAVEIKRVIVALAYEKRTTVASLASAMITWSLDRVRKGLLGINGTPQSDRRKLAVVMVDAESGWNAAPVEIPEYVKKPKNKRMVLTYRLDQAVVQQIKSIAKNGALPEGEVLIRLLQRAIEAYQKGEGVIKTQAVEVRQVAQFLDNGRMDKWA